MLAIALSRLSLPLLCHFGAIDLTAIRLLSCTTDSLDLVAYANLLRLLVAASCGMSSASAGADRRSVLIHCDTYRLLTLIDGTMPRLRKK